MISGKVRRNIVPRGRDSVVPGVRVYVMCAHASQRNPQAAIPLVIPRSSLDSDFSLLVCSKRTATKVKETLCRKQSATLFVVEGGGAASDRYRRDIVNERE